MKRNRKKQYISMLLLVFMVFGIIPTEIARASENENIISQTFVTSEEAKTWARKKGATDTFVNLADLYWRYASGRGGVNPAIAYVQAAKETGYGKFGGIIDESFNNPCGLKTTAGGDDSDPNAHQRFNNWDEGVQAHLDHLALYAGAAGYPRVDTYDPRHFASITGKAKTIAELGGAWAPSPSYGTDIARMYTELKASVPPKLKRTVLDNIYQINNTTINISGWALNPSGIKEVKIYVDGIFKGNANTGIARPDVDNAYPGYIGGANSGYNKDLDLSDISAGNKKIKIEAIGTDGSKDIAEGSINIVKKAAITSIETPNNGGEIRDDKVYISGWALNPSGIKEIKIYVDGKFKGNANIGIARPDVNNVYPGYTNGANSGYNKEVDISDISAGNKKIKIEAMGKDGSLDIAEGDINIIKKAAITSIETPSNGGEIRDDKVYISGWALNPSGIKEIKIYIDGKLQGNANVGIARPDVNNVYPGYVDGANSGYNKELDLSGVSAGNHKIKIEAIGKDGSANIAENTINVIKKMPITSIETPTNGAYIGDNKLYVSGWALNPSGIREIKIYVDGKFKGNANIGIARPDVNNVYPGYVDGANSGYNKEVDLSGIQSGNRTIKIEAIGKDGSINIAQSFINITKKSIMTVETPNNGAKIFGDKVYISGWALNSSGIKEVKIYRNGRFVKNANIGIARPDVNSVYPGYVGGANSGYNAEIMLENYKNEISIQAVGKDGTVNVENIVIHSRQVKIVDPALSFDFGAEGPLPNNPQMLVLHHAAGNSTVWNVHNFHRFTNGWAGIGYHFYIHKDGTIYKGREESWRGAHTGNDNNARSLGISVQGNYENSSSIPVDKTMPKAQEDAVVELGRYLVEKYGINQILGHRDAGQSTCPGRYYPFERIKNRILSRYIYAMNPTD